MRRYTNESPAPRTPRMLMAVVVLALCALLPATAAAIPTEGAISGEVTSHRTKAGIELTDVCATQEFGSAEETCATTGLDGEYIIGRLQPGEYTVDFTGEECYFDVYCFEESFFHETKAKIDVKAGAITADVNAELKEKDGEISGKVTAGGAPVAHVQACVDGGSCSTSNASGEYTIEDVPPGPAAVSFTVEDECKLICTRRANYLTSYYSGQSSLNTANLVTVESEKTTTGVDEEMRAGGAISGKVTTASASPQAIAGLEVCAVSTATNKEGAREDNNEECALTNSSGEYTIDALGAHGYEVDFTGVACVEEKSGVECRQPYVTQYAPEVVAVTPPSTVSGIDASMLEVTSAKPAATAAPVLAGTTTVGGMLSCSQGSWANNPAGFTYRWLRGGAAIAGQTASTYTVQSADLGSAVACEVTAANAAGSSGATSNTLQIPKPAPGVALLIKAEVKGSSVSITLRCSGASACSGELEVLARVVVHKHTTHSSIVAPVRFTIGVGQSVTLRLHLTGKGRKLLAKGGRKGVAVQIAGAGVKRHSSVLK
jgi:hypothetical protein